MYYHFSFVLFIFKKLVVFHYTDKIGNVAHKPFFTPHKQSSFVRPSVRLSVRPPNL